jgi:hypothetical protein
MLYVEQPVGTGFSQGVPNIKNEDDLAAQLVGFFQQFLEVFKELKGKNFYLSGESVSGTLSEADWGADGISVRRAICPMLVLIESCCSIYSSSF